MLAALFKPPREILKGGEFGDVVHKDHSMHISVVVFHHTLLEPLLSCSVPQLNLNSFAVDVQDPLSEVHPDGGLCGLQEGPPTEAVAHASLAHAGVAYDDDLEDALVRGVAVCRYQPASRIVYPQPGLVHSFRGTEEADSLQ